MTKEQREVLRKIIYAVETGGQVYNQQNYSDFTEAYTNSSLERSITIGAGQWYGPEAKILLKNIWEEDPELWEELDDAELLQDIQSSDWDDYNIAENSSKAKVIVAIISTDVGIKCQDSLMDEQMATYVQEAKELGVVNPAAQAMCANFRHQGGYGAVTRILKKTKEPYNLDNLYAACQTDTGNQVGVYKYRQKFVYESLKQYFPEGDGNMSVIEKAVSQMETWANDPEHGYDQTYRWGEKGDYDCSSAVISAWEMAGVPVKSNGATYTGNIYNVFLKLGFKDVTSSVDLSNGNGLQRGDILLNHVHHVAMYCGSGKEVEASINEKGTATGGSPGDQTGKEFLIRSYRNYPWDCVLRYTKDTQDTDDGSPEGTVEIENDINPDKIDCAARTIKNAKCYLGAGTSYGQAKLFPVIPQYALIDILKGSAKDSAGNTWYLVKIAHPEKGFVTEYIQEGTFRYLK